jgi:hypothetical protein
MSYSKPVRNQHGALVAEEVRHGQHVVVLAAGDVFLDGVHMPYMSYAEAISAARTRHANDILDAAHGRKVLPLWPALIYLAGFASAAALLWVASWGG